MNIETINHQMPTSILESPSLLTLRIYGDDGGWLAVTRIERIPKPDEYGHDYGHIIHRVDYSHNHVGAWFEPGRLGKSLSSIADSSYSGENLIFSTDPDGVCWYLDKYRRMRGSELVGYRSEFSDQPPVYPGFDL